MADSIRRRITARKGYKDRAQPKPTIHHPPSTIHNLPSTIHHPHPHAVAPSDPTRTTIYARVKKNAAPLPGSLSAQIRPPWRAMMRFTVESPIPTPS